MANNRIHVLLTGGGSGGHVYPLLAVAQKLAELANEKFISSEFHYCGPEDRYTDLLREWGIRIHGIAAGKLRRYFSLANLLDIPRFFIGLIQAFFKVFWLMPDVIFSKGGTGALPVVLAGWFYRAPILVHESDAVPGLTNLVSSRFASRVAVSFDEALNYFNRKKTAVVGNPVRRELLEGLLPKEAAKDKLDFNAEEPLTLILGGSLGSERINEFILENLAPIIKETQILHQTGSANYGEVVKLSQAALIGVPLKTEARHRYKAVPYLEDGMKIALAAADLVVARAGSGTIFELAAFGKPAILIPLAESANDHQRANAHAFAKTGAAIVIEENNLLPGIFLDQLTKILKNQNIFTAMSAASSKFFMPNAAEVIAEELLRIASR